MSTGFTPRLLKGWWLLFGPGVRHRLISTEDSRFVKTLCGHIWKRWRAIHATEDISPCRRCLSLEARWLPESEDTP